jgi:hypothetical protein
MRMRYMYSRRLSNFFSIIFVFTGSFHSYISIIRSRRRRFPIAGRLDSVH